MDKVDVENDLEIGLQKHLRIELCLIREKLLYELNETWDAMLKWTLPAESRRMADKPRQITLEVTGVETHLETLSCTVQAMHKVQILESRVKLFCDRLIRLFIEPVVQDKNTLLQVIDETEKSLCVVIQPACSAAAVKVPPLEVFQKLEQIFTFVHKPLQFIIIRGETVEQPLNPQQQRDNDGKAMLKKQDLLVEQIGCCICKKLFECIYNDCLSHAIPRSARQYENFNEIVASVEQFQELLTKLQFMSSDEASLLDYLNNVNTLFANIKSHEILKKASEHMTQELTQNVTRICSENPLGLPQSEAGVSHPTEAFVKECKQKVGTASLKLPSCQVRWVFMFSYILGLIEGLFINDIS